MIHNIFAAQILYHGTFHCSPSKIKLKVNIPRYWCLIDTYYELYVPKYVKVSVKGNSLLVYLYVIAILHLVHMICEIQNACSWRLWHHFCILLSSQNHILISCLLYCLKFKCHAGIEQPWLPCFCISVCSSFYQAGSSWYRTQLSSIMMHIYHG